MTNDEQQSQSVLFLLRLWDGNIYPVSAQENVDESVTHDTSVRWRGRLVHVLSGEGRSFEDWNELLVLLQDLLSSGK